MGAQYLFKFKLKGTALKGIFNCMKTILSKGLMRWCLTETEIACSEISPDNRILLNYTIEGKNLMEYRYHFKEPVVSRTFEIQELSTPISIMKISDTLKIYITDNNPEVIHGQIIDKEGNVERFKIQTMITQDFVIHSAPENMFSKMPVNLERDTFQRFMKLSQAVAKTNDNKIYITIQSPNYVSFSRDGVLKDKGQSHGKLKKKKDHYKACFYISELKHVMKLMQCTKVLGIYQPIKENIVHPPPLYIRGNITNIGEFKLYIHRCDVEPIKENDL